MNGETRLKAAAIGAGTAMLAGFGIVEALDQFGAPAVLAAFFPLLPLAIVLIIAVSMRSLAFADVIRGGAFGATANGWALAGLTLGSLALVAAPMATALGGGNGIVLIAAFIAGAAAARILVVPALRATEAPTLAAALGVRFDGLVRALATLASLLALLPLLAAEASLAGLVTSRMLGLPAAATRDALIILATLACLFGGLRAAIAMAAIAAPIVAAGYLLPVAIVSLDVSPIPMPWVGLFEGGLAAPTRFPGTIVLALLVGLLGGIGTMPTLLMPAWARQKRQRSARARIIGLTATAAVLLAAPSYGLLASRLGIDAATNPAGLVIDFGETARLSAAPSVLLIGALLTAALVAATAFLANAAAAIGNDLYVIFVEPSAPEIRRIFIARLGAILLAALAAGLASVTGGDAAMLAACGLSIAAASLGPVLLIGWRIGTVTPAAAAAAIAVGLWLTVADIALALLLPDVSGRFLAMGTITPTVLGPTGWFGLPIGLSGLPGTVFGTLTLWAASELPRTDWPKVRRRLAALSRSLAASGRRITAQVHSLSQSMKKTPSATTPVLSAASEPPSPAPAIETGNALPDADPAPASPAPSAEGTADKPLS